MIIKIYYSFFIIFFFAFIIFLSFSCDQNKIIEEQKFIKIYTDIIIAKDTTFGTSQSKDAVIKGVLAKYSVTLDDYKSTVQYYNLDSERWEQFFAKAITYLEEKRKGSAK